MRTSAARTKEADVLGKVRYRTSAGKNRISKGPEKLPRERACVRIKRPEAREKLTNKINYLIRK